MRTKLLATGTAVGLVLGMGTVAGASHLFPDVADDNVHVDGIDWASTNGLFVGDEDGNYNPAAPIQRDQAASVFQRYHETFHGDDLTPDSVVDADDFQGPAGPSGPSGPAGPQGPAGDDATVGLSHWSEGGTVPAANRPFTDADPLDPTYSPGYVEVVAECVQDDHYAIGGGFQTNAPKGGITATLNRNTTGAPGTEDYATGWIVGYTNFLDEPQDVRTYVVCAAVVEDEPVNPS